MLMKNAFRVLVYSLASLLLLSPPAQAGGQAGGDRVEQGAEPGTTVEETHPDVKPSPRPRPGSRLAPSRTTHEGRIA